MRILIPIALMLVSLLTACREKEVPKAVAVNEDGSLELQLCSFNVRYEGDQDEGWKSWPERIDRVVTTLREINADVFGIQEARHGQVADLQASLADYGFSGVGRDDGERGGEYAAIFWKSDRFVVDPEEQGTFWLSDTPETPGSMTWGNQIPRVATWVRLSDRSSGLSFYVFNTHWDHRSQKFRERAAPMMASRVDARRHQDEPVILLGDFNATRGNAAVNYLTGERAKLSGETFTPWAGALEDPYQQLRGSEVNRRTLHFWEADRSPRLNRLKVDHILVSRGAKLLDAGIKKAPTREAQPSDHYPVWVRVAWPE